MERRLPCDKKPVQKAKHHPDFDSGWCWKKIYKGDQAFFPADLPK